MSVRDGVRRWDRDLGRLRLVGTDVENLVGSASGLSDEASDSVGGGISSRAGWVKMVDSEVEVNQATAAAPNGRFAEGGGIYDVSGDLDIQGGSVSSNWAVLDADLYRRAASTR